MANSSIDSQLKIGPSIYAAIAKPTYEKILAQSPKESDGASLLGKVLSRVPSPPSSAGRAQISPTEWVRPVTVDSSSASGSAGYAGATSFVTGKLGKGAPGIARNALRYLGVPYVWGGESPSGFDCSGLLQYAAAQAGIKIPRTTYQQWQTGRPVGMSQLKVGDAVFFRGSDSVNGLPGHVGIFIGNGKFVEAAHSGTPVRVASLAGYPGYMGARRYGR